MTTSIKTCFKCGAVRPLTDFYRHPAMADGHLNKCKACTKRDVSEHRAKNIEHVRAYDRARGNRQPASYRAEYLRKYPERRKANNAVGNALRDGRLWKSPCCMAPDCYSSRSIVGHHTHYDAPLCVVWLCQACHVALHKQFGDIADDRD